MKHPWDEIWPVPEGRGDFALQVLQAYDQGNRKRRPWLGWLLAALIACLVLAIGAGVAFKRYQDNSAKRAAIMEAQRRDTEERLRRPNTHLQRGQRVSITPGRWHKPQHKRRGRPRRSRTLRNSVSVSGGAGWEYGFQCSVRRKQEVSGR